jgi:methylated-DNA-[protein]-cysteine S-methyltransferase
MNKKTVMNKKVFVYETILGKIGIVEMQGVITDVFFNAGLIPAGYIYEETALLKDASRQLSEYLDGGRTSFDLPLRPDGTVFEKKCWEALLTIPYGETRTYSEQARLIGNPKACRAVGGANSRNPISIFIPCHRVIGTNGKLTGFAGGLDIKKKLLEIEAKKLI